MSDDVDVEDLHKVYVKLGRNSDNLADYAQELLPPSSPTGLPDNWTIERLSGDLSSLGPVYWSKRNTYHFLLVGSTPVCQIWTTTAKTARTYVNEHVYNQVKDQIIGASVRPYKGLHGYLPIRTKAEVELLVQTVKRLYGV